MVVLIVWFLRRNCWEQKKGNKGRGIHSQFCLCSLQRNKCLAQDYNQNLMKYNNLPSNSIQDNICRKGPFSVLLFFSSSEYFTSWSVIQTKTIKTRFVSATRDNPLRKQFPTRPISTSPTSDLWTLDDTNLDVWANVKLKFGISTASREMSY